MKKNNSKKIKYTGIKNLELVDSLENYNNKLTNLVKKYANKKSKILDFGAGTGYFATNLIKDGFNVSCVEKDDLLYKTIKTKNIKVIDDIKKAKDNFYDLIYTFNVLEHIKNDKKYFKFLKEKLKPNGILIVYVPAFNCLFSSMDKKVKHFRRYHKKDIKNICNELNLKIIKNYYTDSIGFFVTLLFKLLGNNEKNLNAKSLKFYDKFLFPLNAILDKLFLGLFGKNIILICQKK